jgi:hypothetical protein
LYGNQWLITAAQCVDGATQFTFMVVVVPSSR